MGWKLNGACFQNISATLTTSTILSFRVVTAIPRNLSINPVFALVSALVAPTARTPMTFLASYMTLGVTFETDACAAFPLLRDRQAELTAKINATATFCTLEMTFKPAKASDLACAILFHARQAISVRPTWSAALTNITQCDAMSSDVQTLVRQIRHSMTPRSDNDAPVDAAAVFVEDTAVTETDSVTTRTPNQSNKENLRPKHFEQTSPVSIANMDFEAEPASLDA
jgi:Cyclin, C-terminal domain